MDNVEAFDFDFDEALEDVHRFYKVKDNVQLFGGINDEKGLKDHWLTEQQSERDKEITKLLKQYVLTYTKKTDHNAIIRIGILVACLVIIGIAIAGCWFTTVKLIPMENKTFEDIISLITVYCGVIVSTFGIVKTTTKYIFPENEEQYITEIVKAIQKNDLENKKVNIKANSQRH